MSAVRVRYKIKATVGARELEVVAMTEDEAEGLFNKYKKEILMLK